MPHETRAHPSSDEGFNGRSRRGGSPSATESLLVSLLTPFPSPLRYIRKDSVVSWIEGRRRLTSRVHRPGMEVEQLHLVLLAFALPRLGAGAPDGMRLGRDGRGMIVRSRESLRRPSSGNGCSAAHLAREHLARWQMNMASFCLRTKASFVPSRSPMHHNTAAVGHVGFARAANRAPRSSTPATRRATLRFRKSGVYRQKHGRSRSELYFLRTVQILFPFSHFSQLKKRRIIQVDGFLKRFRAKQIREND